MAAGDHTSPPVADDVALRLLVGVGDPVTGTVAVEGEDANAPFTGWVELMAAINAARAKDAS